MKKATLITTTLLLMATCLFGQTKPSGKRQDGMGLKINPTESNEYKIYGDQNINLLYGLLQAGYQAVQKSDDFSKTQVKQYMQGLMHLDSLLRPQIMKFHPDTTKKK